MRLVVFISILFGFTFEVHSQRIKNSKTVKEISFGIGLPIHRFDYLGAEGRRENGLGSLFDIKYILTGKKIAWLIEADFAYLKDKYTHLSRSQDIYFGHLIVGNLRASIGYTLKLRNISVLPGLGISQQFILHKNYKISGNSVESDIIQFPHLLPFAQLMVSYSLVDNKMIGLGYLYQQKINYPWNLPQPSVYIKKSDSITTPSFDKVFFFVKFKID